MHASSLRGMNGLPSPMGPPCAKGGERVEVGGKLSYHHPHLNPFPSLAGQAWGRRFFKELNAPQLCCGALHFFIPGSVRHGEYVLSRRQQEVVIGKTCGRFPYPWFISLLPLAPCHWPSPELCSFFKCGTPVHCHGICFK